MDDLVEHLFPLPYLRQPQKSPGMTFGQAGLQDAVPAASAEAAADEAC